jgi:hypothetical protein
MIAVENQVFLFSQRSVHDVQWLRSGRLQPLRASKKPQSSAHLCPIWGAKINTLGSLGPTDLIAERDSRRSSLPLKSARIASLPSS